VRDSSQNTSVVRLSRDSEGSCHRGIFGSRSEADETRLALQLLVVSRVVMLEGLDRLRFENTFEHKARFDERIDHGAQ
jgi:hypothetical protein